MNDFWWDSPVGRCKEDHPWKDLKVKASTLYLSEPGWRCGEGCERGKGKEEKQQAAESSTTAWSFKQCSGWVAACCWSDEEIQHL